MNEEWKPVTRRTFGKSVCAGVLAAPALGYAANAKTSGRLAADTAAAIRPLLKRYVDSKYAPGMVAIVSAGTDAAEVAEGTLDFERRRPARSDSLFRIASMTKPVTAAAALMLVEDGAIGLSEPISRFLPEFARPRVLRTPTSHLDDTVAAQREIRLVDVLTSTVGHGIVLDENPTPYQTAVSQLPGFGMPDPSADISPDEWVRRVAAIPLLAQPGERWVYGASYCLLGVIIERVSGIPFPRFLEDRIFAPLKMGETSFSAPSGGSHRVATAYLADAGKTVEFDGPDGMFSREPKFPAGDSGLVSTARDYLRFARFLESGWAPDGKQLLSKQSLAAMTINHLSPAQMKDGGIILGEGRGWGYGLAVAPARTADGLRRGAYGWNGGFGTSWFNDPATGLTAILLSNRLFDGPETPALHQEFWKVAYASVRG